MAQEAAVYRGKDMKRKLLSVFILLVFLFGFGTVSAVEQHKEQTLNFVVMGDNRPANVFRPEQPYIYHKVVEKAVELDPVLILNTGDLVLGYDADSRQKAREEFDDFEKATAPIRKKNIPLYITMGNHSGYTEFAREAFAKRYKNTETGELYYSVDVKNCHFIVLCSELVNEVSQITGRQLEWLKGDLKRAGGKHIFCHAAPALISEDKTSEGFIEQISGKTGSACPSIQTVSC